MLPWALCAFNMVIGNSFIITAHGHWRGPPRYFAIEVLPDAYGADVVKTPRALIDARPAAAARRR